MHNKAKKYNQQTCLTRNATGSLWKKMIDNQMAICINTKK